MKLYHGSNFRLTDLTVRKGDLFNGMFFSSDMESAQGPGASHYYYSTEIDEDDIAELYRMIYLEDSSLEAKKLWGDDADIMLDIVYEFNTANPAGWNADEEQQEVLNRLFPNYEEWELNFELQRQASLLAEEMGYKAVAVDDEHGTSYIVIPGAKMKFECEDE